MRPWKDCQCFSEIFAPTPPGSPASRGLPSRPASRSPRPFGNRLLYDIHSAGQVPHGADSPPGLHQEGKLPSPAVPGSPLAQDRFMLGGFWSGIDGKKQGGYAGDTPKDSLRTWDQDSLRTSGFSPVAPEPALPIVGSGSITVRRLEKIRAWSILPGRHTW